MAQTDKCHRGYRLTWRAGEGTRIRGEDGAVDRVVSCTSVARQWVDNRIMEQEGALF